MSSLLPIMYRQEFDALVADRALSDPTSADYYSSLLTEVRQTDARKLGQTWHLLTPGQRSLYALGAFDGETCNGGVSQFFHNTESREFLWTEADNALRQLNLIELAARYSLQLRRAQEMTGDLRAVRAREGELLREKGHEAAWSAFKDFQKRFDGESEDCFDDFYYKGQSELLFAAMRRYVKERPDQFVIFCDGDAVLEREKARRGMKGIARAAIGWIDSRYASELVPLLFSEEALARLGADGKSQAHGASSVLRERLPLLKKAAKGRAALDVSHAPTGLTARARFRLPWLNRTHIVAAFNGSKWRVIEWD